MNREEIKKATLNLLKMMGNEIPEARLLEIQMKIDELNNLLVDKALKSKNYKLAEKMVNLYEQIEEIFRNAVKEFIGENALTKIEE